MVLDEASRRCGTSEFGAASARSLRQRNKSPTSAEVFCALTTVDQTTRSGVTHLAVEHFALAGAAIDDCAYATSLAAAPQSYHRYVLLQIGRM